MCITKPTKRNIERENYITTIIELLLAVSTYKFTKQIDLLSVAVFVTFLHASLL